MAGTFLQRVLLVLMRTVIALYLALSGWQKLVQGVSEKTPLQCTGEPSRPTEHFFSPHLEAIHRMSIYMSGSAVTILAVAILVYLLFKWKVV